MISVPLGITRDEKAVDTPRLRSGQEGLTLIIGVPLGLDRSKKLRSGQEGLTALGERGKGWSGVEKEG